MAESSYPFDSQVSTEAQWSTYFRNVLDTGTLTGLAVYADASGMFIKIPAGQAVVRGFFYTNDTLLTLPVTPSSTATRYDTVVLQLDPTANVVTAQVKAGNAGDNAGAALAQTDLGLYELALAIITVNASTTTIAAGDVTDRRTFSSTPWGRWTTATRPTGAAEGKAGWNTSLKRGEAWDGTSWQAFGDPSTTNASALTAGVLPNARLDYGVVGAFRGDRGVDAPVNGDTLSGDWNLALQPGSYRVSTTATNTNAPAATLNGVLLIVGGGATLSARTQVFIPQAGTGLWFRGASNGTDWGAWRRIANFDELGTTSSGGTTTGTTGQSNLSSSTNATSSYTTNKQNGGIVFLKTGQQCTLQFNLKATVNTGQGTSVVKVPDSALPLVTADCIGRNNSDQIIQMAIDVDGYVRIRSGNVGQNAEIYGTMTYVSKS